jgi:hypothetical protein
MSNFCTSSRARLRRARPGRARPKPRAGTRKSAEGNRELERREPPAPGGGAGDSPTPGRLPPHPQAAGTRSNAPPVTAPTQLTGPPSPRRAFCRRAKITVKSARYARVLRMALRATPDCDLPRQDPVAIRRTDLSRLRQPSARWLQGAKLAGAGPIYPLPVASSARNPG